MAVIGEVIKTAIEVADKWADKEDIAELQKEDLIKLLKAAKDTDFGKHYDFEDIMHSIDPQKEFAQRIPFYNYETLRKKWWQRVIDGESNVTWPGKVKYFAVSSGTTGKKKRIPITEEMFKSIRRGGLQQITATANFDLPAEFFEKEILMFGSSTDIKTVNGRKEGEISGISAARIPGWFEIYYRPGKEVSSIDDWDERVNALAKKAPEWDIGSISGIPSWIELMMKRVIEYHNLKTIHDIWPNLRVYTSGGVAFDPYRKAFDKITEKPLTVIDTYLASEGYLATQTRPETDAMALITGNGIYFEFVPFDPKYIEDDGNIKNDAPSHTLQEVKENEEYVLVISTVAGAWRYVIGDTIMFTDKKRAEIKITGRTKHFLNVVGAQLSVIQMSRGLKELEKKFDCNIKEFTVAAVKKKGEYIHRWYLGSDREINASEKELAEYLDQSLQDANKNYGVARSKALKGVEVKTVPADLFQKYVEETNQKGGQVKMPRVMKEEDFKSWEEFVDDRI